MKRKRKPITAKEMEAAYKRCLKREYDRERKWKKTKQGAFESAHLRLDMEAEEARERENSVSWLSDQGRGARQMYRALDPRPPKPTRAQLIERARKAISRHIPECLPTFWLVIKNGTNRKESIWELMRKRQAWKGNLIRRQKRSTLDNSKKS